jgi:mRNA interferase MazF
MTESWLQAESRIPSRPRRILADHNGTRVVVLPITSNVTSLYSGEAMVSVKGKPGRALGDQIRSIDKGRLKARAGAVTTEEMARIDAALAITLALQI